MRKTQIFKFIRRPLHSMQRVLSGTITVNLRCYAAVAKYTSNMAAAHYIIDRTASLSSRPCDCMTAFEELKKFWAVSAYAAYMGYYRERGTRNDFSNVPVYTRCITTLREWHARPSVFFL